MRVYSARFYVAALWEFSYTLFVWVSTLTVYFQKLFEILQWEFVSGVHFDIYVCFLSWHVIWQVVFKVSSSSRPDHLQIWKSGWANVHKRQEVTVKGCFESLLWEFTLEICFDRLLWTVYLIICFEVWFKQFTLRRNLFCKAQFECFYLRVYFQCLFWEFVLSLLCESTFGVYFQSLFSKFTLRG